MPPNDRKHKAARLAARIFATVLFPDNRWEWQKARDKVEKILLEAAEQLLDACEERRKRNFKNFANIYKKNKKRLDFS
jgi:hypothetical protein